MRDRTKPTQLCRELPIPTYCVIFEFFKTKTFFLHIIEKDTSFILTVVVPTSQVYLVAAEHICICASVPTLVKSAADI